MTTVLRYIAVWTLIATVISFVAAVTTGLVIRESRRPPAALVVSINRAPGMRTPRARRQLACPRSSGSAGAGRRRAGGRRSEPVRPASIPRIACRSADVGAVTIPGGAQACLVNAVHLLDDPPQRFGRQAPLAHASRRLELEAAVEWLARRLAQLVCARLSVVGHAGQRRHYADPTPVTPDDDTVEHVRIVPRAIPMRPVRMVRVGGRVVRDHPRWAPPLHEDDIDVERLASEVEAYLTHPANRRSTQ